MKEGISKGGQTKINEYIERIKKGEDKDKILQNLPSSWISNIENQLSEVKKVSVSEIPPQLKGMSAEALEEIWVNPSNIAIPTSLEEQEERLKEIERRKAIVDKLRTSEAKYDIKNIENKNIELEENNVKDSIDSMDSPETKKELYSEEVINMVEKARSGKPEAVQKLWESFLTDKTKKKDLLYGLFQTRYKELRESDYPIDKNEEEVWEKFTKNQKIPIHISNDWVYRGIFPTQGQETKTRGSFNVHVTPELINKLDDLILKGKIKANYKFGAFGTSASPTERHDSITIYFLEEPSEENLKEITETIKPFIRGGDLLGKKISEGFYMSEIGNIESSHIQDFVINLEKRDKVLYDAIYPYVKFKDSKLKMSEAQFYAVKDTLKAFGYNLDYNKEQGFTLK